MTQRVDYTAENFKLSAMLIFILGAFLKLRGHEAGLFHA